MFYFFSVRVEVYSNYDYPEISILLLVYYEAEVYSLEDYANKLKYCVAISNEENYYFP